MKLDGETVIAGAIVGTEERNVGRVEWKRKPGNKFVAAILMNTVLMFVGGADAPVFCPTLFCPIQGKIVFYGGACLQCVRGVVIGIDESALAAIAAVRETGRISKIVDDARSDGLIDRGESIDPAVLREIVVIETNARAKNGMLRSAGRISEPEPRRESFAVVVREAADERHI